jgi:hypothetical protein
MERQKEYQTDILHCQPKAKEKDGRINNRKAHDQASRHNAVQNNIEERHDQWAW